MTKILSLLCSINFFINAALHYALFLGAPFGQFIWGGYYTIIPKQIRIYNLLFFVLWFFCGITYLTYGKVIKLSCHKLLLNIKIIIFTLFLFLASVFNLFVTTSSLEKYCTGSMSILTFVLSITLVVKNFKLFQSNSSFCSPFK